ncbi:MAG: hypothetical protein CMO61_02515 [Verrucomicrobiales bacterium]|nr:hypothetical protein [Verrucomicrobiales bacterium]|tara:strand:+ start:32551 stop:33513 length:963 start_codon:yes stop_codon:yes gene_type:complete
MSFLARIFIFTSLLLGMIVQGQAQRAVVDEEEQTIMRPPRPADTFAPGRNPTRLDENKAASKDPLSAQISAHILTLAQAEREKRLQFMQVVINDVVRLCKLNGEQQDQLLLAAKGAAERSMKNWHEQSERYFRARLKGADSDTAKEILEGMAKVNFGGNRSKEEGESRELWKDTLSVVLSEKQIARYEEVLEQRNLDRINAFSSISMTTLDGHLRLTPDQKEGLGELVYQAAVNHLDDVKQYWGDYFEKGMLMSLANANEDEVLQEILTEGQFERLKSATANFDHFWDARKLDHRKEKEDAENRGQKAKESSPPSKLQVN